MAAAGSQADENAEIQQVVEEVAGVPDIGDEEPELQEVEPSAVTPTNPPTVFFVRHRFACSATSHIYYTTGAGFEDKSPDTSYWSFVWYAP